MATERVWRNGGWVTQEKQPPKVWTNEEIKQTWKDIYDKSNTPRHLRILPLTLSIPPLMTIEPVTIDWPHTLKQE